MANAYRFTYMPESDLTGPNSMYNIYPPSTRGISQNDYNHSQPSDNMILHNNYLRDSYNQGIHTNYGMTNHQTSPINQTLQSVLNLNNGDLSHSPLPLTFPSNFQPQTLKSSQHSRNIHPLHPQKSQQVHQQPQPQQAKIIPPPNTAGSSTTSSSSSSSSSLSVSQSQQIGQIQQPMPLQPQPQPPSQLQQIPPIQPRPYEPPPYENLEKSAGYSTELKSISEIKFFRDEEGIIGEGTFGKVYKAVWRGTLVAVKFVNSFVGNELSMLINLRHPNLLLFMGYCRNPSAFITEYMPNGSLFELLHTTETQLKLSMLVRIARDIALGMHFLHTYDPKIIHRDLKTGNILLDEFYRAKVADFGTARRQSLAMMTSGTCTYSYSAPELLRSGNTYSEKVDIFSYGIILWEMLTRTIPYETMSTLDIGYGVANCYLRPGPIPSHYPTELSNLISCCWLEEPSSRPSFEQILEVFSAIDQSSESIILISNSANLCTLKFTRNRHIKP